MPSGVPALDVFPLEESCKRFDLGGHSGSEPAQPPAPVKILDKSQLCMDIKRDQQIIPVCLCSAWELWHFVNAVQTAQGNETQPQTLLTLILVSYKMESVTHMYIHRHPATDRLPRSSRNIPRPSGSQKIVVRPR